MGSDEFRGLPSVEEILTLMRSGDDPAPHNVAVAAARAAIADAREAVRRGEKRFDRGEIVLAARTLAANARRPALSRVINATGVLLQTNLGRAPLGARAMEAITAIAGGYSNLEFELESGARGSRHDHLRPLLREVTGAEDGIVVNNNAAALLMALQVFASGREVIVSRGQAVEIGGGFRIPDVLRESGARLVEVGTTNRTYGEDYRRAIGPATAAILRVHTSNFRVVGFATEPTVGDLAVVARDAGVILLDDLGSGCLIDTRQFGLAHEPTVGESVQAGADLALFSGDKLLGGPQAGILVGKAELVAELRRHPLARALRVDKLTLAALEATLRSYAEGRAAAEIPLWQMVATEESVVRRRARRWARAAGERGSVVATRSMVGGGSLPGEGVPSWAAAIAASDQEAFNAALRRASPPVIARISEGRVLLDPRGVDPGDDRYVASALISAIPATER